LSDTRIVDEYVELAEPFNRCFAQSSNLIGLRAVGLAKFTTPACGFRFMIVNIGDENQSARALQALRNRGADPRPTARHDRRLAGEIKH